MKIDKHTIKRFEKDQRDHSTETAIFNLFFDISSELLHALDEVSEDKVKRIKVQWFPKKKK